VLSSRLHWDLSPNPLTELLRSKRSAGANILDLTESNPTQAGLNYPGRDILSALADPRALRYEPSPAGLGAAREAIAESYPGMKIDPSRILLTASTSEAYSYVMKLLANPGDELLVPRPSYPLFDYLAGLESVRVTHYPLVYDDGWSIDMDALAGAITERTRAVAVVNPNNPTGSFVKRGELERLVALCEEHGLAIVSDEVFSDYSFAPDRERVEHLVDVGAVLTFCLSGLSKVAGLPQLKLGWIVTGGPSPARKQAMEGLELIADTYLSVAAPVQHAAAALLRAGEGIREQIRVRTRRNLDVLRELMAGSVNRVLRVEGGWYATVQAPLVRSAEEWALELLGRCDTLVQPGYFYDFDREALLVVSLLTPEGIFREGVGRVMACVERALASGGTAP
jgi:alanine-synthesizing transaminase